MNLIKKNVALPRAAWLAPMFAGALCLVSSPALAHDAWAAPGAGPTYPIQYGHEELLDYPAHKVKAVQAFNASGGEIPVEILREERRAMARPESAPAMLSVFFDNGYFSKVDGKSRNVGKREAPGATDSSHPVKWSKTILSWSPASFRPLGQRLEIVPLPFAGEPTAGAAIKVRVLLEGKPLPKAKVTTLSAEESQPTDAQGEVTFKTTAGVQRLTLDHRIATPDDPDADHLALNASLVFVTR